MGAIQQVLISEGVFSPIRDISWDVVWQASAATTGNVADGATVQNWTDARGQAKVLTQGTAADRPIYRAAAAVLGNQPAIQGDAVSKFLSWTRGAGISDPFSVVMVGAHPVVNSGFQVLLSDPTVAHAFSYEEAVIRFSQLCFLNNLSTDNVNFGWLQKDTIGHVFSIVANGTSSKYGRDGLTRVLELGASALGGILTHCLNGGSLFSSGHVAFIGVYSGDITADANYKNLLRSLSTTYALAIPSRNVMVCDGDSRTWCLDFGNVGNRMDLVWPTLAGLACTNVSLTCEDIGIPSQTMATQNGRGAVYVDAPKAAADIGQGWYYFNWGGVNDLAAGTSAAALYALATTNLQDRRAAGFRGVGIGTIPAAATVTGGNETARVAYNALVIGNAAGYDLVVDFAGNAALDYHNATGDVAADNIHWTIQGCQTIATQFGAAISATWGLN